MLSQVSPNRAAMRIIRDAETRDSDRWPRLLHGPRVHHRGIDPIEPSLERRDFVGEHRPDDLDVLLEPIDALLGVPVGQAGHRVRRVVHEAGAETELDATVRDLVEGQHLASQHRRISKRDLGDRRRQPDRRRRIGEGGQRGPRLEPWRFRSRPVDKVIGQRGDFDAQLLEPQDALSELGPRDVREQQDVEAEWIAHLRKSGTATPPAGHSMAARGAGCTLAGHRSRIRPHRTSDRSLVSSLDKVALFTNEYPPNVYGGAGVHVEYLSRELARLVPVEVRCFGDQDIEHAALCASAATAPGRQRRRTPIRASPARSTRSSGASRWPRTRSTPTSSTATPGTPTWPASSPRSCGACRSC